MALVSSCLMVTMVVHVRSIVGSYASDFAVFYVGGHLIGGGDLYDHEVLHREEQRHVGGYSPDHGYVRLPFYALLFRPLSYLDYAAAEWVWHVVRAAAVIGFIALWPVPGWRLRVSWVCLSLPTFAAFVNGQDSPLLLILIAAALHFHQRGDARAAGLIAAVCSMKLHLFLLLPVWIAARRDLRFLEGLAAGGAVLALVSFAAAGLSWPLDWFRVATSPDFSPSVEQMPNLYGVIAGVGLGPVAEAAAAIAVAAAVWFVARRADLHLSLACCLVGGLLVSRHAYLTDMVILLPAALSATSQRYSTVLRVTASLVLLPPTAYATVTGPQGSAIAVGVIVLFLGLIVREAYRPGAAATAELHS